MSNMCYVFIPVIDKFSKHVKFKRLSLSHYRAVNNGILDTYQLKSLDGVLEAGIEEIKIVKRNNKLYLQFKEDDSDPIYTLDNFALRDPYDKIIRCLGFKFDNSIFTKWVALYTFIKSLGF